MSSISSLLVAIQFEKIQFEVEQELQRVLDLHIVAEHLITKGASAKNKQEVLLHLDEDFIKQFPSLIDRVVLDCTAIPSEIPVLIRKKKYKVSGEVWFVHQSDVDPFPSSPHAHNYDANLTMHLGNGNIYRKREYICKAKEKTFLKLRDLITNVELPPLEISP